MAILEFISDFFKEGEVIRLSSLLQEGVVSFLEENSRNQALRTLVDALCNAGKIQQADPFYHAILRREKIVSTGIGMGVAVPHAKLEEYAHFFIALGIQKGNKGIEWDALDKAPVRLIFMIGGPADRQSDYLKILSRLTAAIKDEQFRQKVYEAESRDEVLQLFEPYE